MIKLLDKSVKRTELIFWILIAFILFLATYKYVAHGEPYLFSTPWTGETVEINSNIISQDIVVDENSVWESYSYAIYLYSEDTVDTGYINVLLKQSENTIGNQKITPSNIENGWYVLDDLNYKKLQSGTATVEISGIDLDKTVYVGICGNIYNIPNYFVNGDETEYTLTQQYHYNFNNFEYKIRCLAFIVFVFINIIAIYVVLTKEDNKRNSNRVRLVLVVSYMCLAYIYDSSLYILPTWAEAVTNYMHNGINSGLADNILISDAGYLPLVQRLIALIVFKIFRLTAYHGLFVMQIVAYILSGCILSFFSKNQFSDCTDLRYRYVMCLLFMMQVIDKETGSFINFIVYGIIIILFYYLADSEKWSKKEFILICIFGGLSCLSKGSYVTILPFMIVCMILFFKNYSKRDLIFSGTCALAAFIQLIYYLKIGLSVFDWVDYANSSEKDGYYLKLVLQTLIDVPNKILGLFSEKMDFFNGISLILIIVFWVFIVYIFVKYVILNYIKKGCISKNVQIIFMLLIYITAQSLFNRITIYGTKSTDIASDEFWLFENYGTNVRSQIFIYIATAALFVVFVKILNAKKIKNIKQISVLVLILCMMLVNGRLQLKGIGNDNYSNARTLLADTYSEMELLRNLEESECRLTLIQPNGGTYNKNAEVYCLGSDIIGMQAQCIESGEPWTGDVCLSNYPQINTNCGIWQIFIKKQNLINRNDYKILMLDSEGNIIVQKEQDNSNYQKITSFTFDEAVEGVSEIVILNSSGNRIFIENAMYIVTEAGSQFLLE